MTMPWIKIFTRSWMLYLFLVIIIGDCMAGTPWSNYKLSRADVCRIESEIKELPGGKGLDRYSRYYAGRLENGRYVVTGVFLADSDGAVEVVPYKELPLVFDGGCDVITFKYDLQEQAVVSMHCDGDA